MKTKFIGVFVCVVLITAMLSTGKPIQTHAIQTDANDPTPVPVWHIGDIWSYDVKLLNLDIEKTNQSYQITIHTENLTLKVMDDTGGNFTVALKIEKIGGNATISYRLESGFFNVTVDLTDVASEGKVIYDKTTLGIRHLSLNFSGRLHGKITELPVKLLRNKIPIRGQADISLALDYNVSYPLIVFPLDITNLWGRPAVNITLGGTIESRWLNRINTLNNIIRKHWGIVDFVTGILQIDSASLHNLSDACDDILPVVNIVYVLNKYSSGNVFQNSLVLPMFLCLDTEDVTVNAGTFTAYNITVAGQGGIYYAPSVGNIIKISGHFTDAFPFAKGFELQLIHTNYQG